MKSFEKEELERKNAKKRWNMRTEITLTKYELTIGFSGRTEDVVVIDMSWLPGEPYD